MHEQHVELIRKCENACLVTLRHCLEIGGKHAEASHITMLLDCANICRLNVSAILLKSSHSKEIALLCADICDACADDCDRLADDEHIQRLTGVCRTCAEACKK